MDWLKRFLTPPLIVLAALVMWWEEWLWERLKWLTGLIAWLPFVRWYDAAMLRLPLYPMMVVFLLPLVLLFPVKLLALYWLAKGYWLASATTYIAEKVFGTAIVARSYVICRPRLLTIVWFRRLHDWLIVTRNHLYSAIRAMPIYQRMHSQLLVFKETVRRLLSVFRKKSRRGLWSRWHAIRRWHRVRKAQRKRSSGHGSRG